MGGLKMPIGLFLIIHDDVIGPHLKCQYLKKKIDIHHEFVSNLYLNHAGNSDSMINESKLKNYRIISYYTGNLARLYKMEGIFGIILEENEPCDNLAYFLHIHIEKVILSQSNEFLKKLYEIDFKSYYALIFHLKRIKIQGIISIHVVFGNNAYLGKLLRINTNNDTIHIDDFYYQIIHNEKIEGFYWFPIPLENEKIEGYSDGKSKKKKKHYLIIQTSEYNKDIDFIISNIKKAVIKNPQLLIEQLYLLLAPSEICIIDQQMMKQYDIETCDSLANLDNFNLLDFRSELEESKNYSQLFINEYNLIKNK